MLLVILRILQAAVAISLLIVVHEFGHLVCAKAVGMRVETFSIGFWKRLFGIKIGDTDYRVSLVPLGGFVKVSGESAEEGKGQPYEFWSKTPGQRAFFVIGGVAMNVVAALPLFIIAFAIGVPFAPAWVGDVEQGSPAWKVGIERGDRIVRVGDVEHPMFEDLLRKVALCTKGSLPLEVDRGGRLLTMQVTPEKNALDGHPQIGLRVVVEPVVSGLAKVDVAEGPSPARDAGIELGDTILAINDIATPTAGDVERQLLRYPNDKIAVRVKRGGNELTLSVRTRPAQEYLVGISGQGTVVKELQGGGIAEKAGLRVDDRITAVNGSPVDSSSELSDALRAAGGSVTLGVDRAGGAVTLGLEAAGPLAADAFMSSVLFRSGTTLAWVRQDGPAWLAGMRVGDTIVSVAGHEVEEWADVLAAAGKAGRNPREMVWRRGERTFSATVTPVLADSGGGGFIGVLMDRPVMEPRKYGAISAIAYGFSDFKQTISDILVSLWGIFTSKISPKTLGGIVIIARYSYLAATMGLGKLLCLTATVSLGLAFMNVLPVPVLDGGHLLFLAIEKLRGRRVSEKVMGIAQTVGFVLLMLLVVYATRNDIMHLLNSG